MITVAAGVLLLSIVASLVSIQTVHHCAGSTAGVPEQAVVLPAIDRLTRAFHALDARLAGIVELTARQPQPPLDDVDHEEDAGAMSSVVERSSPPVNSAEYRHNPPPGRDQAHLADILLVDPTPEQQALYEAFDKRLDDPEYLRTLSMKDLLESEELNLIPDALRRLIISKAVAKVNEGTISLDAFIQGIEQSDN